MLDQKSRADKLERSNDDIFHEYINNIKALFKSQDDFIGFNSAFQLLHCASNKFLSAFSTKSASESENNK